MSFHETITKRNQQKNRAEEKPEYFTVWFNCWRYEKEDELWAAFALCLMKQLSDHLSWKQQLLAQLKLRCLRLKFKWKGKNSNYLHILSFIFAIFIFIYSIISLVNINSINELSVTIWATLAGIIVPALYFWKDLKDVVGNPFEFSKLENSLTTFLAPAGFNLRL
ncbi:hypothetical protein FXV91_16285 [Methanosarcina sp. DH2]|nr:hypothetical protein [Methanosarcina sp. DH2]